MKVETTIQGVERAVKPIKLTPRSLWEDAVNGGVYELHKIAQTDSYMLVDQYGNVFQFRQLREVELKGLIKNRTLVPFNGSLTVKCTVENEA